MQGDALQLKYLSINTTLNTGDQQKNKRVVFCIITSPHHRVCDKRCVSRTASPPDLLGPTVSRVSVLFISALGLSPKPILEAPHSYGLL